MIRLFLLASLLFQGAEPPGGRRLSALELASGWQLDAKGERERDPRKLPGRSVELFDGKSLAGWRAIGVASYTVDEGAILGQTTAGKANAFLVSDQRFGDFLLELELKNEQPGNSGIQIRSRVVGEKPEESHATGYQIEIDPSARAWSGGLYEERGRGWLQNLEQNEAGRKAFRAGEWNRFRIECVGPWIRAWVNDVPTADALDPEALEGIIGLQVHAGKDTRIRFRGLRLQDFGRHEWKVLDAKTFGADGAKLGNDFGLRLTRPSTPTPLTGFRLCFRGQRIEAQMAPSTAAELLHTEPGSNSIDLGDPRLANSKDKSDWKQLTVLAYSGRVALFRDHELVLDSPTPGSADGPWVWIERPSSAGEPQPFAHAESLEQQDGTSRAK